MVTPFFHGVLFGLATLVFLGPVVFTLLQATLLHGRRAGFMVATGIMISDVVAAGICALGLGGFMQRPDTQLWLAGLGTLVLIGLGIAYLMKKPTDTTTRVKLKASGFVSYIVQGFAVNFINPFVIVVWLGLTGYAKANYGEQQQYAWVVFLAGVIVGIYTIDTVKVFLGKYLARLLRPKTLRIVYRVIGAVLLVFAIRLLVFFLNKLL